MAAPTIVRPERCGRAGAEGANLARASSRHGELLMRMMGPVATRACDGRRAPRGGERFECASRRSAVPGRGFCDRSEDDRAEHPDSSVSALPGALSYEILRC